MLSGIFRTDINLQIVQTVLSYRVPFHVTTWRKTAHIVFVRGRLVLPLVLLDGDRFTEGTGGGTDAVVPLRPQHARERVLIGGWIRDTRSTDGASLVLKRGQLRSEERKQEKWLQIVEIITKYPHCRESGVTTVFKIQQKHQKTEFHHSTN